MPETTPLIKAALNLRGGAGFDVYDQKRFVYSLRGLPIIMGSPLKMEVALWRKETFPYMTPFTQT